MNPIVVVGSGMAGYTLARELRKASAEAPLLIITADDAINYSKPVLSNALSGGKLPEQIGMGDHAKMTEQLKASIMAHTQVLEIDKENKTLTLRTDAGIVTQPYAKLVLAVGASPIRIPIEGDGTSEVYAINSLIDYKTFHASLAQKKSKRVLLLGAGLIGCEFANDLLTTEHDVTVVDLAPRPLGRLLPQEVAIAFQKQLEAKGIRFELATTVKHIAHTDTGLSVTLANGQTFEVDIVLSAIGLKPNTELAHAAELAINRGIQVNQSLQTSHADIYAMGDCAEVEGHLLPYVMPLMQQARALAQTLTGNPSLVHYPAMPVSVKTPAAPLVVLPPAPHLEVTWNFEELEDGMIAKATIGDVLQGFILLGPTATKQRMALTKLVPDLLGLPA
ncbi:NAD(P)/FAD-dependent oxidoreductase [Aquirhabdus parva]|uniref:FAD-dependent oxidoreductase n=1 Tax=Aquirhabdus parva TaxID=2283318 RepID=A0A345P644_9GAMM|nr:FAD-dependent oxidoreductase [Aquirhabdus parva]AXI02753.1 FAD-dependent oxidoreductase [Aquirhabdus parva]